MKSFFPVCSKVPLVSSFWKSFCVFCFVFQVRYFFFPLSFFSVFASLTKLDRLLPLHCLIKKIQSKLEHLEEQMDQKQLT